MSHWDNYISSFEVRIDKVSVVSTLLVGGVGLSQASREAVGGVKRFEFNINIHYQTGISLFLLI